MLFWKSDLYSLDYKKQQILAEEKQEFHRELGMSGLIDRESLKQIASKLDENIGLAIKERLFRLKDYIYVADSAVVSKDHIHVDGVTYAVTVDCHDSLREKVFKIYFLPDGVGDHRPPLIKQQRSIHEQGRFNSVEICAPRDLEMDHEFLFYLSVSLFNIGYSWLNTALIRITRDLAKGLNSEMYEFIHRMVQNEKLLEGFIFSVLTVDKDNKVKDFVLLDENATKSLIKLVQKSHHLLSKSPAVLISDMIFDIVPVEESVIKDVVNSGSKQSINLNTTNKYSQSDLSMTLKAVWGDQVCCYPIMNDGQFMLVAFYPMKNGDHMSTHLDLHKSSLKKIALNNLQKINSTLDLLNQLNDRKYATFSAEVFGAFVKGLLGLDSIQQ